MTKPLASAASKSLHHVRGRSAGRDADRNVSFDTKGVHLPSEHVFIPVIVADSRERRSVGRERQHRKRSPLHLESAHELCGDVLRIGSAASIPEEEDLATVPQSRHELRYYSCNKALELRVLKQGLLHLQAIFDRGANQLGNVVAH